MDPDDPDDLPTSTSTFFNGRPATVEDLGPLAFAGYAHFTAMQVRDGAVRGLDLHLERLRAASDELFGRHLPSDLVREHLAAALVSADPDVSLTCYVNARPGEFQARGSAPRLDLLVRVDDPVEPPAGPLDLDLVEHHRDLPHIKHVGEIAKTWLLRQAHGRGLDDAAFVDADGRLGEATIWNLALWDGRSVIWPEAQVLPGVTMQILRRQLPAADQVTRPVLAEELGPGLSAVVMNSWSPGVPLTSIGGRPLGDAGHLVRTLHRAFAAEAAVAP